MLIIDDEVILRPISTKDTDFLLSIRNDIEFANEFFSDPPIYDFVHLSWLQNYAKNNIELIIEYKEISAGHIRLTDIDYRNQKAQFGILISKNFQMKGLGFKASKAFLDYVFNNLPINKIYLELFLKNLTAQKLYKKLGFEMEGCHKEEYYKNGEFCDVIRMALLRKTWNK